jgi:hypothetical protein
MKAWKNRQRKKVSQGRPAQQQATPDISALVAGIQRLEAQIGQVARLVQQQPKPESKWIQRGKIFLAVVGVMATFLAVRPVVYPSVSIQLSKFDPRNPKDAEFLVMNSGPFAIADVKVGCVPYSIRHAVGELKTSREKPGIIFRAYYSDADRIAEGSGETFQYVCAHDSIRFGHPELLNLDFAVVATYRPLLYPLRQTTTVHFVGARAQDGSWHLRQRAY